MRVHVTQAAPGSGRTATALLRAGFSVAECPLIRIEAIEGPPIRAAAYDWLVLTSANAVEPLFDRLDGSPPRVAVIGPATADALREYGVEPALVARNSTQEGIVEELPRPAGRVLFAGAEGARDVLARELGADFVPLYRTVALRTEPLPQADLVVLASPSAARAYAALESAAPCVAIGPVTSTEARRLGLRVAAEAESPDPKGLVRAVRLAGSRIGSSPS